MKDTHHAQRAHGGMGRRAGAGRIVGGDARRTLVVRTASDPRHAGRRRGARDRVRGALGTALEIAREEVERIEFEGDVDTSRDDRA